MSKEREAFNSWWSVAKRTLKCDDYDAFEIWQAAKAQAVSEGFVVLAIDDMERICRCLDDHAVYITYKASDALESIQKAMTEAQHPSSTSDCPDEP